MEYKEYTLKEIMYNFKYGTMPNKARIKKCGEGDYPIFTGYLISGYYDECNIENETLIVVARGVGGTGDVKLTPEKCFLTNLSIAMFNDEEIVSNKYLYYYFRNHNLRYLDSGSAQSQITINDLKTVKLLIPNKTVQEKIVKILVNIDKKIELNNQMNENLLKIGMELLKKDFNKRTELDVLSNVVKFVKGKKPLDITSEMKEGYEKYLTIACLNGQELNYADTTKMVLSNNDLLMVMDGASSGDVYYGGQGIVGSTLSRVDCTDNNYSSEFIYFVMKYYKTLIQSKNTGSAIPHTDKVFVGTLEIPKILKEQQEKYEVLLNKILHNVSEIETLTQLRNTILPKIMNGEIDLDTIEI